MNPTRIFVPDGVSPTDALARTTHLAIGAHPDDLEVMAYPGVAACYERSDAWFGGVVICDGAGSPHEGKPAPEDMKAARRAEQERAAQIGRYSFSLQLGLPSAAIKTAWNASLVARLAELIDSTRPQSLYLHSPFDRHATHLAVFAHALRAVRALPEAIRPATVLGCEVWRDLDWLSASDKVQLDASAHPKLAREILDVFGSQIQGGKNYTEATLGRRRAHATFSDSHHVDAAEALSCAVDLGPLLKDPSLSVAAYCAERIERFRAEALGALAPWEGD
ncbi:MAG: PIG-L family deacetylase [Elusimicrobia bacterium CG_4_9_14_3_um_filter_62_55]|nr:MAG: PIG-L family deacetylase [Elusimicrobia bacterium CG22_combo_CG10-13_8_21_14_all_63_91]PJA17995.1 MAG: PIG-L family deacetylase [Elusimicrobia bacterium CG_4_10_14_0_2_um_filter_63_34]PJB24215.1 MAG: PIG-L family deacetylase [Elusimicrobia bacterium CG_4_9_14_3_um_filter_62_55]